MNGIIHGSLVTSSAASHKEVLVQTLAETFLCGDCKMTWGVNVGVHSLFLFVALGGTASLPCVCQRWGSA